MDDVLLTSISTREKQTIDYYRKNQHDQGRDTRKPDWQTGGCFHDI